MEKIGPLQKAKNLLQKDFTKKIEGVYFFYHQCFKEKSPYCVDLWYKNKIKLSEGSIVPMFEKNGRVAWYKIIKAYYKGGGPMSDWAFGDDGKYRDLVLDHID